MKRSTPAKRLVLATLQTADQPLQLKEIWQRVCQKMPAVAFSTIFRIVENLRVEGKITAVDWRERAGRYELSTDHHHHIRCLMCGEVVKLTGDEIDLDFDRIAKTTKYHIKNHMIELEGVCAKCQAAQKGSPDWHMVQIESCRPLHCQNQRGSQDRQPG